MYPCGRPNRTARLLNRGWAIAHAAGLWPSRLVTLEVAGRRTGRPISFPLVMVDYDDEHYLVSMLGEGSNWVRNVRAARGHAVLRHGRRESVRLEEVDPHARAPILRRYYSLAPGARAFISIDRCAPINEFEAIAPRIPVFRVTSEQSARERNHVLTLTFDELALIYASLQAVKTLSAALPPQEDLLNDTMQVVDQALNDAVR